jgi:hypothetical protein
VIQVTFGDKKGDDLEIDRTGLNQARLLIILIDIHSNQEGKVVDC